MVYNEFKKVITTYQILVSVMLIPKKWFRIFSFWFFWNKLYCIEIYLFCEDLKELVCEISKDKIRSWYDSFFISFVMNLFLHFSVHPHYSQILCLWIHLIVKIYLELQNQYSQHFCGNSQTCACSEQWKIWITWYM